MPGPIPLPELKDEFFGWIDRCMARGVPSEVQAFHFCLYEGIDCYEADLFGCQRYEDEDPAWACEWCFEGSSRFDFLSDDIEPEWEIGLQVAQEFLSGYLDTERPGAKILKAVGIVTVGFCDGDIEVVLKRKNA